MTQQKRTFIENIVHILCRDRERKRKKMHVENIYC